MLDRNRPNTQAHDGQVIVGIKNNLQNVSSLPLASSTYTMAALEQLIQSRIDAANAVVNARAHWVDASATYETLNTNVTKVVRALRQYVINVYGPDSPVLADFGFTATKRSPLTPEQLVARGPEGRRDPQGTGNDGQEAEGEDQGHGRHDRACDSARPCDCARGHACGPSGRGRARSRGHAPKQ